MTDLFSNCSWNSVSSSLKTQSLRNTEAYQLKLFMKHSHIICENPTKQMNDLNVLAGGTQALRLDFSH